MKVHEETYRGHRIEVYNDENAESPQEWQDDELFLVHYHRYLWVENDRVITEDDCARLYCGNEGIDQQEEYHIFWVTAHIHGGVWLYLGNIAEALCDAAGWDTSRCGAVLVSKKEWPGEEEAEKAAWSLVTEWNDYLSGNVYGFVVDGELCDDSYWGFYGDWQKWCLPEAKIAVDNAIRYAQEKHCKALKKWIGAKLPLQYRKAMPV